MSLTKRIAQNTAIQIIGKIISVLAGTAAFFLMANYLGAEQFGWYTTTISFLGFAGILVDFGLIPISAQMLSEPRFDQKKLLSNLFTFRLTSAAIFFLLAPSIGLLFPYPVEVKWALWITSISFFAMTVNQIFMALYQVKLKLWIPSITEVCSRLFLLLLVILFMIQEVSFLSFMIAISATTLLSVLINWYYAHKEIPITMAYDKEIWYSIIQKSWPVAVSIMFNVIYLKGDTLILTLTHSQETVGVYGLAYKFIDIVTQIAMMTMGILLPLMAYHWSRNKKTAFQQQYQQAFDLLLAMAMPLLVGIAFTAIPLMTFFDPSFRETGIILQILSIAVFGVYLGAIFGHTAVAIDKQKETLWIYASNAILTLIAYLLVIPRFGIIGAAWVTVASELYAGFLLFVTIRYYSKVKLQYTSFFKISLASLLMGIVVYFCLSFFHLFSSIFLAAIIYVLLLVLFKVINISDIQSIIDIKKGEKIS